MGVQKSGLFIRENRIIKIQNSNDRLTLGEKNAVSRYLKTNADDRLPNEDEEELPVDIGFADAIIAETHREKRRRLEVDAEYVSTVHVLSQSNLCERLFSLAKLILSDRRQSMHPSTFNNLLLLKLNHKLWSVVDIQMLLNSIGAGEPNVELSDDEDDVEKGLEDENEED